MAGVWEIVGGPEPWKRAGNRDEVAWRYSVAKSAAERGTVVFAMTGTAAATVEAGGEIGIEVEDAHRSKGLFIVQESLSRTPRPRTIMMSSTGQLTFEP